MGIRNGPRRRSIALVAVALAAQACSDDGSGPGVVPRTVTVDGGADQAGIAGEPVAAALTVRVQGSDGRPFEGARVAWRVEAGGGTVSDEVTVSSVLGVASTRWTLGPSAGVQTVSAAVQGLPAVTFTAHAGPGPAARVIVSPSPATLEALQATLLLSASLTDAFGNVISGAGFTWASADESVVAIDPSSGLARAVSAGAVAVTASALEPALAGTVDVVVRQVARSLIIRPRTPRLAVGATFRLEADVRDAMSFAIADAPVQWTSSAPEVAAVDSSGVISALAAGTARIRASSGTAVDSTDVVIAVMARDFVPDRDVDIAGAMTVGNLVIPAGVTVTVTADAVITALGDVRIDGTLAGACVAITVNGHGAATYTGTVRNACPGDEPEETPGITLVNDGPLTLSGAGFSYAGSLDIRNSPRLSDDFAAPSAATAGTSGLVAAAASRAGHECTDDGARFAPSAPTARHGRDGVASGSSGRNAGFVRLSCDGDAVFRGKAGRPFTVTGRHGGDGGDALNPNPRTNEASGKGGNGGNGGDVHVSATGDIRFESTGGGTVLRLTDGGNGGDATVLGRDPGGDARAEGGDGGNGGEMFIEAGGSIAIEPGALTIVVGAGGKGGEAVANAGDGRNAGATAASDGGNATATGGAGGHSVHARLRARGLVIGRANVLVTGGDGGDGGAATAVGGRGGSGNAKFPDGAAGGAIKATGGIGGLARTRDLTGATIGTSGDGGDIRVSNGRGGDGAEQCAPPDKGGKGGDGGAVSGRPGAGGGGDNPGMPGSITVVERTANGGNGNDGIPPGAGGDPGADQLARGFLRTDEGPAFQPGTRGRPCPLRIAITWTVLSDPNGHTPFTGLTELAEITVRQDGDGGITLVGPVPWVTLTGRIDDNGDLALSGRGPLAGFNDVLVTFVGHLEGANLTGTLTVDADNNRFPPNGAGQRNPAVYRLAGTVRQ